MALTTGIFKGYTQSNENVGKTVGAGNVILSVHFFNTLAGNTEVLIKVVVLRNMVQTTISEGD